MSGGSLLENPAHMRGLGFIDDQPATALHAGVDCAIAETASAGAQPAGELTGEAAMRLVA
ncbi:MAG TPA: hypothetical protein VIM34_15655 [Burkholderiaceae bacterium]